MPEERLQYGFRKTPTIHVASKVFPNIAEERLQAVDRAVVELKPLRQGNRFEEVSEEVDFSEEDDAIDSAPGHLALGDIGYGPARHYEPLFEARRCDQAQPAASCHDPQPAEAVGNCGFRRGELVLRASGHHAAQPENVAAAEERVIEFSLAAGQYDGPAYDRFRRQATRAAGNE